MSCRRCSSSEDLQPCLQCGRSFCPLHRGELEGEVACSGCLEEEAARRQRAAARRDGSGAPARAAEEPPAPPPLLPEPPGNGAPLLLALAVAAPSAGYLAWYLRWLGQRHDLPAWLWPAGAAAGFAAVACGVFAITKSRAWSRVAQAAEAPGPHSPAQGGTRR